MAASPSTNGFARPPAVVAPQPSLLSSPSASSAAARQGSKSSSTPRPKAEPKSPALAATTHTDAGAAPRHAHDRLVYLLAAFVGQPAVVTLVTSQRYSGVFSAASLDGTDHAYVLKMTKLMPAALSELANGSGDASGSYVGYGDDHVMSFDVKDVVCIEAANVVTDKVQSKLTNGSSFRTDADISGNLDVKERMLEAWQDTSLQTSELSMTGNGIGNWDQFAENEKRFGVKTDYDETMYTTAIDRNDASYKVRMARANKMAREIEESPATNSHVAEERNLIRPEVESMDEESKYSGVARAFPQLANTNPNAYTPPAKRAPTAQATVAGAPVDPAIISASLIRPDSYKPPTQNTSPSRSIVKEKETVPSASSTAVALPQVAAPTTSNGPSAGGASTGPTPPENTNKPAQSIPASLTRGKVTTASGAPNATANVERDVSVAFRQWSAEERSKLEQVRQRNQVDKQRKDREDKFADLKKFSDNFKLKTVPPHDILGILARDKAKQQEIERKAEEQRNAAAAVQPVPALNTSPSASIATSTNKTNSSTTASSSTMDRAAARGPRPAQGIPLQQPGGRGGHSHGNGPNGRAPGQLSQRLNQSGRIVPNGPFPAASVDPRTMPLSSSTVSPDVMTGRRASVVSSTSTGAPFNVQAMEFKPNPAASAFQPGDVRKTPMSPTRARAPSSVNKERPMNAVSFFGDKKPAAEHKKKSIRDGFNPIERMRGEAAASGKTKDFAANGGIPKAFTTRLAWDNGNDVEEGEDRGYIAMATKGAPAAPVVPVAPSQSSTPQQIHPQAQQPYYNNQRTPSYRGHGREYFEDRMHPGSHHSSVHPSPSMRPPMLAPQMGMQPFPQHMMYGQPQQGGRPYSTYMGPVPNFGAPPMVASHSNQGHFMPMFPQGQHMPMYAPNAFPVQGQQMPGNMYGSPRQAQMMLQSGSNHAQMPPQFAPGGPGFIPNPQQMGAMRGNGGYPMQQGPFASPQMPQNRGQFGGGNFPQQQPIMMPPQMHPGQMMNHPPGGPMRFPSDPSDAK